MEWYKLGFEFGAGMLLCIRPALHAGWKVFCFGGSPRRWRENVAEGLQLAAVASAAEG